MVVINILVVLVTSTINALLALLYGLLTISWIALFCILFIFSCAALVDTGFILLSGDKDPPRKKGLSVLKNLIIVVVSTLVLWGMTNLTPQNKPLLIPYPLSGYGI